MPTRILLLTTILASLACACGNGTSVQGTLGGSSFSATSAIAYRSDQETAIFIANSANGCSALAGLAQGLTYTADGQLMLIGLPLQLTIGTFSVDGGTVGAVYGSTGATCQTTSDEVATTGTVTVSRSDATAVDATFDLFFRPQSGTGSDHVTGTFAAPLCAVQADAGTSMSCH